MDSDKAKVGRELNRVLWITGLVIGVAIIAGAWFFYGLTKEASEIEAVISTFMSSIEEGDIQSAYGMTSKDFRARNSGESFGDSIKQLPAYFSGFERQNKENFSKGSGPDFPIKFDYLGSVHYEDGSEGVVGALLVEEEGAWKIYAIYFEVSQERLQAFGQKEAPFGIDQNSADHLPVEFSAIRPLPSVEVIESDTSAPAAAFLADQLQSSIPIPSADAKYKTAISSEELIAHYDSELTRNGWSYRCTAPIKDWGRDLGGWERLYTKDGYLAALQYAGSAEAEYGWNYSLYLTWSKPGELCAQ